MSDFLLSYSKEKNSNNKSINKKNNNKNNKFNYYLTKKNKFKNNSPINTVSNMRNYPNKINYNYTDVNKADNNFCICSNNLNSLNSNNSNSSNIYNDLIISPNKNFTGNSKVYYLNKISKKKFKDRIFSTKNIKRENEVYLNNYFDNSKEEKNFKRIQSTKLILRKIDLELNKVLLNKIKKKCLTFQKERNHKKNMDLNFTNKNCKFEYISNYQKNKNDDNRQLYYKDQNTNTFDENNNYNYNYEYKNNIEQKKNYFLSTVNNITRKVEFVNSKNNILSDEKAMNLLKTEQNILNDKVNNFMKENYSIKHFSKLIFDENIGNNYLLPLFNSITINQNSIHKKHKNNNKFQENLINKYIITNTNDININIKPKDYNKKIIKLYSKKKIYKNKSDKMNIVFFPKRIGKIQIDSSKKKIISLSSDKSNNYNSNDLNKENEQNKFINENTNNNYINVKNILNILKNKNNNNSNKNDKNKNNNIKFNKINITKNKSVKDLIINNRIKNNNIKKKNNILSYEKELNKENNQDKINIKTKTNKISKSFKNFNEINKLKLIKNNKMIKSVKKENKNFKNNNFKKTNIKIVNKGKLINNDIKKLIYNNSNLYFKKVETNKNNSSSIEDYDSEYDNDYNSDNDENSLNLQKLNLDEINDEVSDISSLDIEKEQKRIEKLRISIKKEKEINNSNILKIKENLNNEKKKLISRIERKKNKTLKILFQYIKLNLKDPDKIENIQKLLDEQEFRYHVNQLKIQIKKSKEISNKTSSKSIKEPSDNDIINYLHKEIVKNEPHFSLIKFTAKIKKYIYKAKLHLKTKNDKKVKTFKNEKIIFENEHKIENIKKEREKEKQKMELIAKEMSLTDEIKHHIKETNNRELKEKFQEILTQVESYQNLNMDEYEEIIKKNYMKIKEEMNQILYDKKMEERINGFITNLDLERNILESKWYFLSEKLNIKDHKFHSYMEEINNKKNKE